MHSLKTKAQKEVFVIKNNLVSFNNTLKLILKVDDIFLNKTLIIFSINGSLQLNQDMIKIVKYNQNRKNQFTLSFITKTFLVFLSLKLWQLQDFQTFNKAIFKSILNYFQAISPSWKFSKLNLFELSNQNTFFVY